MSIQKSKIKDFPNTPGIYQFLDNTGRILYIGKAKNLKNRIKSYFAKEVGRGSMIDLMLKEAEDIKLIETESEIEAVILEADLINKISPKYNIRSKDDKSFLVIKITKEEFSVVSTVRYRDLDNKDKSAEYFGPYPAGDLLKKSLRYIRKIIPFRDCSPTKYSSRQKIEKRCLLGDLNLCDAPCEKKLSAKEYQKNIKMLKDFLRGKKQSVSKAIFREMQKASKQKKYEEAKVFRDRLNALEHINKVAIGLRDDMARPENILFRRIECYDISNISGQFAVGSMIVFSNGEKDKNQYRKFKIKWQSSTGDIGMLKETLVRRFKNDWEKPNLIIIDGGIAQLNIAQKVLQSMKIDVPVLSIAKGEKRKKNEFHYSRPELGKYLLKNIDLQRVVIKARNEAHRFAISYYRKLHTKDMLNED